MGKEKKTNYFKWGFFAAVFCLLVVAKFYLDTKLMIKKIAKNAEIDLLAMKESVAREQGARQGAVKLYRHAKIQERKTLKKALKATRAEKKAKLRLFNILVFYGKALEKQKKWLQAKQYYQEAIKLSGEVKIASLAARLGLWRIYQKSPIALDFFYHSLHAFTTQIAFSSKESFLLSANYNGTLKIWDTFEHRLVHTLTGHKGAIYTLAVFGDLVASAGSDGLIKLWNISSGKEIATLDGHILHKKHVPIRDLSFSTNGLFLASAGEDMVRIWEVKTGKQLYQCKTIATAVAFSPDNSFLAIAGKDGKVKLWHFKEDKIVFFLAHSIAIKDVVFNKDGQKIITAGEVIKVWDVKTKKLLQTMTGHKQRVYSAQVSPGGKLLFSSGGDSANFWNLETGKKIQKLSPLLPLGATCFSADGRLAASSGIGICLWLAPEQSGIGIRTLPEVRKYKSKIATKAHFARFSLEEQIVVLGKESHIEILDAVTGQNLKTLSYQGQILALSKNNKLVLVLKEKKIEVWNTAKGQKIYSLDISDPIICGDFSGDNQTMLIVTTKDMATIEIVSGRKLYSHSVSQGKIVSAALSFDGTKVIVGCQEPNKVKLVDLTQNIEKTFLGGHGSAVAKVVFSADETLAASASADQTIKIWNIKSKNQLQKLLGHKANISSIAFSENGKQLVSCDGESVFIWDIGQFRQASIHHEKIEASCASFSKDGSKVVIAKKNSWVIWNLFTSLRYKQFTKASPSLHRALEKSSNNAKALAAMGHWYFFRGQFKQALNCFEKAYNYKEDIELSLAHCYVLAGKKAKALKMFQKALEKKQVSKEYLELCIKAAN